MTTRKGGNYQFFTGAALKKLRTVSIPCDGITQYLTTKSIIYLTEHIVEANEYLLMVK